MGHGPWEPKSGFDLNTLLAWWGEEREEHVGPSDIHGALGTFPLWLLSACLL
jgi:hypothetical protein